MVHFRRMCSCKKGKCVEARIYKDGSYEERTPWIGGFNVHLQGKKAHITLLDKGWSREVDKETAVFLQKHGVKVVHYEHNGVKKTREL